MNLIKVENVPKVERNMLHNLQDFINEFINSDFTFAKVNFNDRDYKSAKSCYQCLWLAIRRMNCNLTVRVIKRADEVYLIKNN